MKTRGFPWFTAAVLLKLCLLIFTGCKSAQRADRSAVIAAQGNASIESWRTKIRSG